MGWLSDKFGKQAEELVEKIQDKIVVSEQDHQARLAVCNSCEKLSKFHMCAECHCYMPLKTKFAVFNCPLKKW